MFCILSVVGFYLSGVRLKVQGDLFEIDTKWISRHPRYTQIGTFVFESNMCICPLFPMGASLCRVLTWGKKSNFLALWQAFVKGRDICLFHKCLMMVSKKICIFIFSYASSNNQIKLKHVCKRCSENQLWNNKPATVEVSWIFPLATGYCQRDSVSLLHNSLFKQTSTGKAFM